MEEEYDILDINGNPLWYKASKEKAHKEKLIHKTSHIWLVNNKRQILMQKRSLVDEDAPGLYDISVAGHISAGETSQHAAYRELQEELGVEIPENEIEYIFTVDIKNKRLKDPTNKSIHIHDVFVVRTNLEEDDFKINPKEVDSVQYFDIENLKKILLKGDENFVDHKKDEYPMFFDWIEKNF